jgi:glucosyl-3-phosphoglycerate synthase
MRLEKVLTKIKEKTSTIKKVLLAPSTPPKVVVVFPAKNEERTIGACIDAVKKSRYNPSIMVVDGHSTDGTRDKAKEAGADVVIPKERKHPGKGLAMKIGIEKALEKNADVILFLDADIENLSPEWVDKLVDSLVIEGYEMARGTYLRAPQDAPVTKLVARELLRMFFPEITHIMQPLSGEVAARAEVWKYLLQQDLPDGWGIDVAILIETVMGNFIVKETFLGTKVHRSFRKYREDVSKLAPMSRQVSAAILQKAKKYGRIDQIDLVET